MGTRASANIGTVQQRILFGCVAAGVIAGVCLAFAMETSLIVIALLLIGFLAYRSRRWIAHLDRPAGPQTQWIWPVALALTATSISVQRTHYSLYLLVVLAAWALLQRGDGVVRGYRPSLPLVLLLLLMVMVWSRGGVTRDTVYTALLICLITGVTIYKFGPCRRRPGRCRRCVGVGAVEPARNPSLPGGSERSDVVPLR